MTLEHELPGLLDELAADHDVGPAPLRDASDLGLVARHHQHSSVPRVLAVAACAGLVVGGLVLISSRSDPDRASGNEPSAPDGAPSDVVLAPSPSGPVELLSVLEFDRSTTAAGALLAPDGTVFSLIISAGGEWPADRDEWNAIPEERRDIRAVSGREVAAVVDATASTQVYRRVRDACWTIELITSDEAMWSDDVAALIGALGVGPGVTSADEAAVTVSVPAGWTSLGGGRMLRSWVMELQVDVDGRTHDVHLAQVPDAPVGFLLAGESNPRPFEHDGRQWWTVDIVTTPGMTSVVGTTDLGAFHITADLPADELATIVDSLVVTSTRQLNPLNEGPPDTAAVDATGAPAPGASCGDLGTGLDLVG